jgi:tetratricopeptide (TPR) repeat protein
MLAKGMCVGLLVAIQLVGQTSAGLLARIQGAPLTPVERQAVTTAWSQKEFDRLEAVLIGAARTAAPKDHASALCALLGALEFAGGRIEKAVRAFQQADLLSPLDDRDRFTLAMALIDAGDAKGSRIELTRLNQLHPNQAVYLYWLGRLDYDQRLYDDAVEKFKRVIGMEPDSARGYDNLGLAYDMLGLTEEAQTAFTKAAALNRKLPAPSPWPPDNLGYFQLRQEQFDDAEKSLREALKYDPKFALAHYHLARVLEKKSRDDEAVEEYKTAAAQDLKLALPLYSLGMLYRRRGQDAEAAVALAEYRKRRALIGNAQ